MWSDGEVYRDADGYFEIVPCTPGKCVCGLFDRPDLDNGAFDIPWEI